VTSYHEAITLETSKIGNCPFTM